MPWIMKTLDAPRGTILFTSDKFIISAHFEFFFSMPLCDGSKDENDTILFHWCSYLVAV